jgi:hypothetical protein
MLRKPCRQPHPYDVDCNKAFAKEGRQEAWWSEGTRTKVALASICERANMVPSCGNVRMGNGAPPDVAFVDAGARDLSDREKGKIGVKLKERLKATLNSVAEGARCRVFVANNSSHRKVLIVADESAIKNLLILVRKLDSRRVATSTGPFLAGIHRRSFDTAILDLRCSHGRPASRGYGFGEVWTSMTGRVLVINAEVNDLKTLEMAERYIYHRHSLKGLMFDLSSLVRSFIGRSLAPRRV